MSQRLCFWYSGTSISQSAKGLGKFVRYIENLDLTNFQENNQNIHYIEGTEHNNISFRSCIQGYHEYKDIWDVVVGEFLEDFKRNLILVCLCRIHRLSHVDIYSLYRGLLYRGSVPYILL